MKIRNYLTIFFAAAAIVLLILLAGFMTIYMAGSSNPLRQRMMELLSLNDAPGDSTAVSEPATEPSVAASAAVHSFLFVGDSRTIGMGNAVNDSCIYIGAEGEGYSWLSTDGLAKIEESLREDPSRTVIFNPGVNDPKNISLYIDFYRSFSEQHPDTSFYLLSVNPLIDGKNFNTTNEMISIFNATLQSAFPDQYLDSYSYLRENGFETVDGLHYTEQTYQDIHDFAVEQLL